MTSQEAGVLGKKSNARKKKSSRKILVRSGYWKKYDSLPDLQKAILAILVVIMLAYGVIIVTGHSIVGTTETGGVLPTGAYGYHGTQPHGLYEIDPAAASVETYPIDVLVGRQYLEGDIPLWNDHQGAGIPLLADFQSAGFFPFQVFQDILPYYLWSLAYIFRLLFAGIFMYLLLRTINLDFYGSITGGVFYILSGALTLLLRLDPYTNVAIMIPALFWAIEKSYKSDNRLSIYHIVISVFVAMTIAGGQPEVMTLVLVSSFAYLLYKLLLDKGLVNWQGKLGKLGTFSLAYALGILLITPLLLPGLKYIFNSYNSHGNQTGLGHNGSLAYITYIVPYIMGQVQKYWSPVLSSNFSWNVFSGYLGIVPIFLVIAGLLIRRNRLGKDGMLFFVGLGLFLVLKAAGFPLINAVGYLPVLDKIDFPRYSAPLIAFCFGVMVAYAISNLAQIVKAFKGKHLLYYLSGVVAISLIPLIFSAPGRNYNLAYLHFSYLYSLLIVLSTLGVLWYALKIDQGKPLNLPALQRTTLYIVTGELLIYIPYGFSNNTILLRTIVSLVILTALVMVAKQDVLLNKRWSIKKEMVLVGTLFAAEVLIMGFSKYGPPQVYNNFQLPSFMKSISADIAEHQYRIYGYNGFFKGDTPSAVGLQDINIMDAVVPIDLATYTTTFLDQYANPVWFDSNVGFRNNNGPTPADELYKNIKYYDLMGVKYLFANSRLSPFRTSQINVDPGAIPLAFDPAVSIEESFTSSTDKLDDIGILTGTYNRLNKGTVYGYIKEKPSGRVLRSFMIPAGNVVNDGYTIARFPAISGFKGKELYLKMNYVANKLQPSTIALWYNPNINIDGSGLFVNGQHKPGAIGLTQYSSLSGLKEIYNSHGAQIYENDGALPRTFFAKKVEVANDYGKVLSIMKKRNFNPATTAVVEGLPSEQSLSTGSASTRITSYRSNIVSITAKNSQPQLLVLTDTYYPGWIALDNGKETPIYRVDGLFRGVVLPSGTHVVQFVYRPGSFRLGAYLFLGAVLIIGAAGIYVLNTARKRQAGPARNGSLR
jgi:hypothetical protein